MVLQLGAEVICYTYIVQDEYSTCDREECDMGFLKAVHNQKYCSPECCRLATNQRLVEQYHAKRKARSGESKRVCNRKDCDTILSKYNKESICEHCKTKRFVKRLQKWGWEVTEEDIV